MDVFSKNQVNFYQVREQDDGQRLDNMLIKLLKGVPKAHIYRIIRGGEVRVNKKRVLVNDRVKIDDIIRIPPISITEKTTLTVPPATFTALYEDEYLLVINKPSGVACHGGSGVAFGVIEQMRQAYPQAKFLELVHRLDKETSGILIIAKRRSALVGLQDQMRSGGSIQKHYLALAVGCIPDKMRNMKAPLFKYLTPEGERRVRVDEREGKYAQTIFTQVKAYAAFTMVRADLKTGRTHQIRVHLQHMGYPIAGDEKYGDFSLNKKLTKSGLKRMFLHAARIQFMHPITSSTITVECELPKELQDFLQILGAQGGAK